MTQDEFDDVVFKVEMLNLDEEIKAYDKPNDETEKAIKEARAGIDVVECKDADDMMKKLFGIDIKDKT